MGSGSGSTTTVQKADPWSGAQPYLKDVMGQAQSLYNTGVNNTYYPGSTVVPFSNETNAALGAITNRATQGSPLNAAAENAIQSTIQGDYLDPTNNPAYQGLMQDVGNRVNSQFGLAGRTGSGANQGVLAREMMNAAGDIYNKERTNQLNAATFAPTLAQQDYYDASQLANVGAQREAKAGESIQDQLARYNYMQQNPWDQLNSYSAIVGGYGGLGGTSTTSQPYSGNTMGSTIGGGLSGAASGAMIGSVVPGIGTGLGAAVGGGLGLLGGLFN